MRKIYLAFLPSILMWSCTPLAYYMSPFNSTAAYYHASPLYADSVKTASYATGVLTFGGSNDNGHDRVLMFQTAAGQARNFGFFGASYGAGFSLGNYHVKAYDRTINNYPRPATSSFSIPSGNRFFGSYGLNGSIHYIIPNKRGKGECRLGIETSAQREFGDYLSFRRALPASKIDILENAGWTKTIGCYFDFTGRSRKGLESGDKLSIGGSFINRGKSYFSQGMNNEEPLYMSNTAHITNGSVTYFCQANLGLHAASLQFGVNYRLGMRRRTDL